MVETLFKELSEIEQVEAIALGGSRAGNMYDVKSDYDVYLYCTGEINENIREKILKKYCKYIEIGNKFWELEDNCTLNNGIDIDILYRNLDDFVKQIVNVVEDYNAYNGYTTCMWHNLRTCKIIYDENGRLQKAKERFEIKYPEKLKENIITQNMRLLYKAMPAYLYQVEKAVERGDIISISHRVAAFMESYFDIIFAMNEMTHPGEKRLDQIVKKQCKIIPDRFEENINCLFKKLYTQPETANYHLMQMIKELEKCLNLKIGDVR